MCFCCWVCAYIRIYIRFTCLITTLKLQGCSRYTLIFENGKPANAPQKIALAFERVSASDKNPQPWTLNPKPWTLDPELQTAAKTLSANTHEPRFSQTGASKALKPQTLNHVH